MGRSGNKWSVVGRDVLLTGTFSRTLDEKLRLSLPKTLREALCGELEQPFYLAPGNDGAMALYPEIAFNKLAQRLACLSAADPAARDYARLFYSQATRLEIDRHGRLRLPAEVIESGQLERDIVLLGVHDHLEIWSRTGWEAYLADRREHFDEITSTALAQVGPIGSHDAATPSSGPQRPSRSRPNRSKPSRPARCGSFRSYSIARWNNFLQPWAAEVNNVSSPRPNLLRFPKPDRTAGITWTYPRVPTVHSRGSPNLLPTHMNGLQRIDDSAGAAKKGVG